MDASELKERLTTWRWTRNFSPRVLARAADYRARVLSLRHTVADGEDVLIGIVQGTRATP